MYINSDQDRDQDKWAIPNAEVFFDGPDKVNGSGPRNFDTNGEPVEEGWYYWFCYPGCLPDSDAFGPYKTEQEAIAACREADQ